MIELLIVIAIIAVLAVAFLPQVLGAPSKGRDAQRLAQMQKLQQFLTAESVSGKALLDNDCIDGDKTADTMSAFINNNIADFGGVYPLDPQQGSNEATGSTGTPCKGYGWVKFDNPKTVKFTGAVFVRMENAENGNVLCSKLVEGATSMELTPGKLSDKDAAGTAQVVCYAALIQ